MLRDVFYYGNKPNVHPREKFAKNLADARKKATTEHFWIINEYCEYSNFDWDFDFEFLPDEDVWAENHNNVWPSVHQKDSGTWLCSKQKSDLVVYRADVDPLKRKNVITNHWKIVDNIDTSKFDFSWHPDPADPPYIYKWGCKYFPVEFKSSLEYHVDGATDIKYMNTIVELLPNWDCIVEVQKVDQSRFDMSWRPDPRDPPYIYVWGNKYVDGRLRSTFEYHAPGATEKKYMPEFIPVLPEWDRWETLYDVDKTTFDFCWRPDPREPDFIYVFGNEQHDATIMPTIEYRMPNATVRKYVTDVKAKLLPHPERFEHLEKASGINYSWIPDPTSPPYIYAWGNQWNKPEDKISIQYVVEGATEYKFMTERSKRKPCMDNWVIPADIDTSGFDFSWEPSPADPPFIYQFGTQWQKTGGPRYVVEGATEVKYIDIFKAKALPSKKNWTIPENLDITGFDFSWHPDDTSPPYVYHFATQWALTGGPIYKCEGATEVKYLETPSAIALPNKANWVVPDDVDSSTFDFSWHPYVEDQPYIYQFGTQHQKTGGPKYVTPGVIPTSPTKYIDTRILKSTKLANKKKFSVLNNLVVADFDYSWHPDDTDEPYIYVFGNNLYPAEIMPTIEYVVAGAKQVKYVESVRATLGADTTNWEIPDDVDTTGFDFSWKPNPKDPPYIYQFGTQHQKTGGPRYVVPDATEVKYIDTQKAIKKPSKKNFAILNNLVISDFDYSWHPDDTDTPYIYQFGNNQHSAEVMPTIEYVVPNATQIKYVTDVKATLGVDMSNWIVPKDVDTSEFDFSWKPNPKDPILTYQFGTQWQKTGGPRYIIEENAPVKYVDSFVAKAQPTVDNWNVISGLKIKDFDYSWHPDDTDQPYIYVFGNTQYPAEIMSTIEYVVPGATQIKYVGVQVATLAVDMSNWEVPNNIDTSEFDFSWKPNPKDPLYIYQFGTQHQKTGGPRYVVEGATEVSYVESPKAKALPTKSNWTVPKNLDIKGFDFSWHPDDTSPPYIYHFATQWALTGGPIYKCPGATETKYLDHPSAVALPDKTNWIVPKDVDVSTFDFSWHPYVEDQPYIYQFGTQHQKTGGPKYVTPGVIPTSPTKYIDTRILQSKKLPNKKKFNVLNNYKIKDFDYSWHPDDTDEPYIYIFGNTQYPAEIMPTIEYVVPGAKQVKYVNDIHATLALDMTNWEIPDDVDTAGFDFSWKPNPKDPPYIYQFGTQWQKTGGPRYVVPDATTVKYIDSPTFKKLSNKSKFAILDNLRIESFDYSWHPDDTDEPYIYVFGNTQYPAEIMPTIEYVVPGATQIKYVTDIVATLSADKSNWVIPQNIDTTGFDFSWKPNPKDPPYIYQFGTQWQKTGGPRYVVPDATEVKYIENVTVKSISNKNKFVILDNLKIKEFDYSWHPDDTDEPYIYVFGNTQYPAEIMPTIEYRVGNATQIKYVYDVVATLDKDTSNWEIPEVIDTTGFDFSWKPNPKDPPYIYQFGTQWQKTGGPRYIVPDATEVKYIDSQTAIKLPNRKNFAILDNLLIEDFDYSWHPDDTDEPYIYVFGNNQYSAEVMPTIEYKVNSAAKIKYIERLVAKLAKDMNNWEVPINVDTSTFDFSWKPNPKDPPYIYQFGTQWQKTGGPKYVVPDATEVKYIDSQFAIALPSKKNWRILNNSKIAEFDYSWHPDETDEPYIYVFGNNLYSAEIMPTVEYAVNDIAQIKYVKDQVAKLDVDMTNWEIPENIDVVEFDFSWKPNPKDPLYIYQFGTQWQKTGGPRYVVPGATEVSYVAVPIARALPTVKNWSIPKNLDITGFDFSWHPDDTSPPYIYHFATQWALTGGPIYKCEGATEVKYLDNPSAISLPNKTNWVIPNDVDEKTFDFSWHPYVEDQPYVYQFGTQWQKTGGPKYVTPGVIPTSPTKYIDTRILKSTKLSNKKNFSVLNNLKIAEFDYSWHPDDTDEPYIYVFGNNLYPAEIMPTIEYVVKGATQIKYVNDISAKLATDNTNWEIPDNIDTSEFDFSWKPNPKDPPYIYQFGTQWQKTGGPRYVVPDATEVKYIDFPRVTALPNKKRFSILNNLKISDFDYSWHHDESEEPYIYVFGNNQYSAEIMPTIEFNVQGAKKVKYISDIVATLAIDKTNWIIPDNIDTSEFDFSWKPNPKDPPYVYQFGTQWQKTGGPRYVVPDATEVKYIDVPKFNRISDKTKFVILNDYNVTSFDYSWHPDDTDEPYIYVFGNTQYPAEIMPTIEYRIEGATEFKYVTDVIATLGSDMQYWDIPVGIDTADFDFSWKPNPKDPPYIYQFGTQWQKTGGPRYVVPDATEVKYVDTMKAIKLSDRTKFKILDDLKIDNFDYSWHPDDTDEPYIYVFGNNQYSAAIMPTVEYKIEGATEFKYVDTVVAKLANDKANWEVPSDVVTTGFDFSWKPNPKDPPYIYQFGTQWQKTGGPRYIVNGATEVKYVDSSKSKKEPNRNNFVVVGNLNVVDFDYSWHPDSTEEPYIYVFGNNQYPAEVMSTIEYRVEGATQIKYINDNVAILGPDKSNWKIPDNIDTSEFDFSWKPNPSDPPYIYEFGTQWQKTGGPRYVVNGATDVKYVEGSKAKALPNRRNWVMPPGLTVVSFDYSWHPDSTEAPYIYQFGTQWVITGGPRYVTKGATEVKYIDVNYAVVGPNKKNWEVPSDIVLSEFDFSWHPHPDDPVYIYQFGTQWHDRGGPRYIVPGANEDTPVKYIDTRVIKATLGPNKKNWVVPQDVDASKFDFSWVPHPNDPPFIYQFGTQWHDRGGPRYIVPGVDENTPIKYIDTRIIKATLGPNKKNWVVPQDVDASKFDFSWVPHPNDPPFIYQFGTQHQKTGGPKYVVKGATDIKYISGTNLIAKKLPSKKNWSNPYNSDTATFDFSWHPDDTSPPYIYQFGTLANDNDGPQYITPNSKGKVIYLPRIETEEVFEPVVEVEQSISTKEVVVEKYYIETTLEDLVNQHPHEVFWALNKAIDYTDFDFTWRPEIIHVAWESAYVNVFGSPESAITHTYFVNAKSYLSGNKDFKFVEDVKLSENYLSKLFVKPDMFFVDRGNSESQARFDKLKERFSNIQKTRYLNSWVDTINRCINRATNNLCWILNSELDYTNFDFNYYPNPWQMKMVHVFGTQWSHWGTTFMVNRETFAADTKYIKIIEHLSNLNFVKNTTAVATNCIHDLFIIDHGNMQTPITINSLKPKVSNKAVTVVSYRENYFETFKDILKQLPEKKEHFIWVCSSICDYTGFDFSYVCDPFAREQLHVFPSSNQKFGDTFLVNVNRLREVIDAMTNLQDYGKINYNQHQRVKRYDPPVIITEYDTHVASIMEDFAFPYAVFVSADNKNIQIVDEEPMNLWAQDTKNILVTSTGGTRIIVPKEAKNQVETQLYDYPYIKTASRLAKSNPLDIVYLSNGETCAEENYEHLLKTTKGLANRVVRVDGVNGRVQAYHAAAEASNTPWMFTVFAKLKVNPKFDWNWQPDRLQMPKHYMFLAKNPVNGLIYGHQGMIAYNKKMTLENQGHGLDFTLDSPHETIDVVSGTTTYNTDEWSTWRTAFREAIKLKKDGSDISLQRLEAWLTKADGNFAQYSLDGANDGIAYYDKVKGKTDKLRLSYEWDWLRKQFNKKYKKK